MRSAALAALTIAAAVIDAPTSAHGQAAAALAERYASAQCQAAIAASNVEKWRRSCQPPQANGMCSR